MLNAVGTVILALVCIGLGLAISEYYHHRIDKARRDALPGRQPDMWDLSKPAPAPAPQPLVNAREFARMKQHGRITKLVGGGRL